MLVEVNNDLSLNPNQIESINPINEGNFKTKIVLISGRQWRVSTEYSEVCDLLAVAKMGWRPKEE